MKQIERLYQNLKYFLQLECLDDEFETLIENDDGVETLDELSNIMEDELSYMAESAAEET